MPRLIQVLKAEHVAIVNSLNQVVLCGANTDEGRAKLLSAKENLITHLQREDMELYPVLEKAAQRDPKLKDAIDSFIDDIVLVSDKALAFFDQYEGDYENPRFERDFAKLLSMLSHRIEREEETLYPFYDELVTD